jgi:hypothetical protein
MAAVWRLPERIVELSKADMWRTAVKEWEPDGVDVLEAEDMETCLCGHFPIKELCYIRNKENGNTAIVGNHCIKKFSAHDPAHAVFGDVPKIIASAKRILQNPSGSASPEMVAFARKKGLFSARDALFYNDIWRKRNLSFAQLKYKQRLNRALLIGVIWSARATFEQLKANPAKGTAGPKLIQHAYKRGVINTVSKDFYMQIWNRNHDQLSGKQARWKSSLNDRIITQLKEEFG